MNEITVSPYGVMLVKEVFQESALEYGLGRGEVEREIHYLPNEGWKMLVGIVEYDDFWCSILCMEVKRGLYLEVFAPIILYGK